MLQWSVWCYLSHTRVPQSRNIWQFCLPWLRLSVRESFAMADQLIFANGNVATMDPGRVLSCVQYQKGGWRATFCRKTVDIRLNLCLLKLLVCQKSLILSRVLSDSGASWRTEKFCVIFPILYWTRSRPTASQWREKGGQCCLSKAVIQWGLQRK